MGNLAKTKLLFLLLSVLILVTSFLIGQIHGLFFGTLIALCINLLIYFLSDSYSAKLFPGQIIEGSDPWQILRITSKLSKKAHIPTPQVFIVPHNCPQSMAIGRHPSCGKIFLTQGLLEKLDEKGLESVIAYHVAGIKQQNTLIHNVAGCFSAALSSTIFLTPLAWLVMKFCSWPNNYFQTDQLAASYLKESKNLATTLWYLNSYSQTQPIKVPWWFSPLFIVSPLTQGERYCYISFQPSVEKRIEKLMGYFPI